VPPTKQKLQACVSGKGAQAILDKLSTSIFPILLGTSRLSNFTKHLTCIKLIFKRKTWGGRGDERKGRLTMIKVHYFKKGKPKVSCHIPSREEAWKT
jgi:hypothetical protein